MKRIAVLIISMLIVGSCFAQETKTLYDKAFPSIVTLKCVDLLGYGFFVDKDLVVTNYQVINKARVGGAKAMVCKSGISYDVLGYVAANQENDLVLLKIDCKDGLPLQLNVTAQNKGNNLFFFNTSNDQDISLNKGIVTAIKEYGSGQFIQIVASMVFLNSGFPVLDEKGEVVGVSVPSPVRDTNANFAIPASKISDLLASKKEYIQGLKDLNPPQKITKDKTPEKSELVKKYLDQGNAEIFSKDYRSAIDKFTMAITLAPGDPDAYVFRGQAKYLLMEYKNALEDFNMAIDIQPSYAEAWDLRGIAKAELGDKTGACEDWQKSYELGFNSAFQLLKQFCDLDKMK
jgi:tetratricopeptide (TPR) repeat protein